MYNSYAHKRRLQTQQAEHAQQQRHSRRARVEAARRQQMKWNFQERLSAWKAKNCSLDLSTSILYLALVEGTMSQQHPENFNYRDIKLPSVLKINLPPSTRSPNSPSDPYTEFNYDSTLRQSGQDTPRMFRVTHKQVHGISHSQSYHSQWIPPPQFAV